MPSILGSLVRGGICKFGSSRTRRDIKARLVVSRAQQAASRLNTPSGPTDDASVWKQIEAQYPGVDVRAIWADGIADAIDIIGADNPALQRLVTYFLHERAAESMSAATQPATAKGDIFDQIASDPIITNPEGDR